MKIKSLNNANKYDNSSKKSFKGMIPQKVLEDLKKQNTKESLKLLDSCLGFNAVYRGIENMNPDRIAREMADKFHIGTDFGNNPFVAAFSALTANICHKLGFALPSNVYLKDLTGTRYSNCMGFCTVYPYDESIFRKFREDFPLKTTVFNARQDWSSIQEYMIQSKRVNHSPTGHFLSVFIHEFMHNAHFSNLQERFGRKGERVFFLTQRKFTNQDTIAMIKKETSDYGAKNPCEMIAEEMTELIVDSLNPKTLLLNEMIFKMNRLKEPFQMDKLIDACWNGDVKQLDLFRKKKSKFKEWINKLKD